MRFAFDYEQFAMGQEVRQGESSGLRHRGVGLSSQYQSARRDLGQLMLNVVAEHLSRGANGATNARSAKIEDPV